MMDLRHYRGGIFAGPMGQDVGGNMPSRPPLPGGEKGKSLDGPRPSPSTIGLRESSRPLPLRTAGFLPSSCCIPFPPPHLPTPLPLPADCPAQAREPHRWGCGWQWAGQPVGHRACVPAGKGAAPPRGGGPHHPRLRPRWGGGRVGDRRSYRMVLAINAGEVVSPQPLLNRPPPPFTLLRLPPEPTSVIAYCLSSRQYQQLLNDAIKACFTVCLDSTSMDVRMCETIRCGPFKTQNRVVN